MSSIEKIVEGVNDINLSETLETNEVESVLNENTGSSSDAKKKKKKKSKSEGLGEVIFILNNCFFLIYLLINHILFLRLLKQ
jgi:hypothetical protein